MNIKQKQALELALREFQVNHPDAYKILRGAYEAITPSEEEIEYTESLGTYHGPRYYEQVSNLGSSKGGNSDPDGDGDYCGSGGAKRRNIIESDKKETGALCTLPGPNRDFLAITEELKGRIHDYV